MFVYTVKSSALKWVLLLALVCVAAGGFWFFARGNAPAAADSVLRYSAANAQERLAFISQFGWEVEEDPLEVTEVLIPAEFDEVYEKYNAIQLEQDLDLSLYSGKRVKRWTYAVKNYPGYETRSDVVQLNLLVCDGVIIGGDVCSTQTDGFMHGFDFPEPQTQTTTTEPSAP